jgi:hypothetical protein
MAPRAKNPTPTTARARAVLRIYRCRRAQGLCARSPFDIFFVSRLGSWNPDAPYIQNMAKLVQGIPNKTLPIELAVKKRGTGCSTHLIDSPSCSSLSIFFGDPLVFLSYF